MRLFDSGNAWIYKGGVQIVITLKVDIWLSIVDLHVTSLNWTPGANW